MGLFRAFSNAINKEYDRRIKRASLITEYGAAHHDHAAEAHDEAAHDEGEAAEIVNVPRGTPVAAHASPDLPKAHD
jgi:hypothetical protein